MSNNIYTYDSELLLSDAGLIAASAAAQVAAADKIIDMGLGFFRADMVVDVTAVEVASTDELYLFEWQLSNSATFASGIVIGSTLKLGAAAVTFASAGSAAGRYILPVTNSPDGTLYRYGRLFRRISGTIATGINSSAFLGVPIA